MNCYIIIFEITSTEIQAKFIEEGLKKFNGYCPMTKNSWAVMSAEKSGAIVDKLLKLLASGDRLYVIKSGVEATWFNSYGEKNDEWLKKRL